MQCAVASTSLCPSEHYLMAKNTHTLFWPTKLPSLDLGIRVQNCPTSEVAACRVSPVSHPLVTPSFIASVQIYTPAKGESWIARSLWTFWQHLAVRTQAGENWIPSLIFIGVLEWQSSATLTRKPHFTHRTTLVCCIQAHKGMDQPRLHKSELCPYKDGPARLSCRHVASLLC